jgi:hypothetical protein
MKCPRGKARKNGGAKGCGKAAEWKSQKTTFPLRLEIPQTPAGFPLSHSLGDCGTLTTNRTFHLLRKGDTSNVVSRGTFLMSVDTLARQVLTWGQNLLCCFAFVSGGLGRLSWQSAALAGELRGTRQDSTESDRAAIV